MGFAKMVVTPLALISLLLSGCAERGTTPPPPAPVPPGPACWEAQKQACTGSPTELNFLPADDNPDDIAVEMPCLNKQQCDAAVAKAQSGGWNQFTVDPGSCGGLGENIFKWSKTVNGIDCQTAPNNPCTQVGIFPAFGSSYPEGICLQGTVAASAEIV